MIRRAFLGLAPAVLLAACGTVTAQKTGTVKTVTVNVAKLDSWAQAIGANADLILALPGVAPALGPYEPGIHFALAMVTADMAAIHKAAGDSATLTFDAGSPPAAVASLLVDAKSVLTAVQGAGLPPGMATAVKPYVAAIAAIVSDLQLLLTR